MKQPRNKIDGTYCQIERPARDTGVGKLIYAGRLRHKMRLREFCRLVCLSPTFISRLETGKHAIMPSVAALRRMSSLLEIPLDDLMRAAHRVPADVVDALCADVDMYQLVRVLKRRGIPAKAVLGVVEELVAKLNPT